MQTTALQVEVPHLAGRRKRFKTAEQKKHGCDVEPTYDEAKEGG
jgi:hypothetical protein